MIDNVRQTVRLIGKLKSSLPVPAVMTPECLDKFCKETGEAGLSPLCMVTQIHYLGDEGGIICGLEVNREIGDRALYVSITHLRFDPRSKLAREIFAYQKHRTKRVQCADAA